MTVLVTGATGNVGRHVVPGLVRFGAPVRAATPPSATPPSTGPVTEGLIEQVAFDFTAPSTWDAAFAGVERMFLLRPPQLSQPGRDMVPALEAARRHGLQHVVLLSLQGAERNPVVPHAALERWLRASGLSWTFVRAAFFMQNLSTTHAADIRDRCEIVVPAGTGRTAFVDAVDVAAVATAALLDPATHAGRAWTPTGPEALSYEEVAAVLSGELGRSIRYTAPGATRYAVHARRRLEMPVPMVAVTTLIYTAARLGRAGGLTDDVRTVTGREPTRFAQFAHRERAAWAQPAR